MAEETTTEVVTEEVAPETPVETPVVKPGYKTTEFWMSVAACALGAFLASGALPEENFATQIAGVILSGLTALGYTVARFMVKNSAPTTPQ